MSQSNHQFGKRFTGFSTMFTNTSFREDLVKFLIKLTSQIICEQKLPLGSDIFLKREFNYRKLQVKRLILFVLFRFICSVIRNNGVN